MDAVRFNQCSPNFGCLKKSAVQKAIQMANGNLEKLGEVKSIMTKQKDNLVYDIEGLLSPREYYNFLVVKRGENSGQAFMRLDEAGDFATMMRKHDARAEKEAAEKAAKKLASKPQFDELASKLLDECEA